MLTILWDECGVKVKKVVSELGVDIGRVWRLLKGMEEVELIKGEGWEVDEGEVFIELSEKSESIRAELSNGCEKVGWGCCLCEDEVKEVNGLLGKVIDGFDERKEK